MKILVAHQGPLSELIAASSVNHGIKKKPIETKIIWLVADGNEYIFEHNKNVEKVFGATEFREREDEYDLCINLWPKWVIAKADIKESIGFRYSPSFNSLEEVFINNDILIPGVSNLQLYFMLAGLVWKGGGYDIQYFPKSRSKRNRVGVSVANSNLRSFVLDKLNLKGSKIWNIPYRKNVFKKMDEINKCKRIITDDLTTFHLAMSLRKYVYLLETIPFNLRIETFGRGEIYKVPPNIVR